MYVYITLIYYIIQNTFYNDLSTVKKIIVKYSDFTVSSRTYISKEEVYYQSIYPKDIIWETIISLSIIQTTTMNHIAQYGIKI